MCYFCRLKKNLLNHRTLRGMPDGVDLKQKCSKNLSINT
jgi:hypothetical protein